MKIRLCLLLFLISLLTGCGFKDLDKRFFVLAIGIDKAQHTNKAYKIILKLAIPSPKIEPGNEKYQIISEEADSVAEAIRLLKSKVDKELDFGHAKMIVFGESLAKESLRDPMDWCIRRREIQLVGLLAMGSPTAEEVLKLSPKSERLPGNALFLSFGHSGTESSYIITEYNFDFYRRMKEKGLDPYLPVIVPVKETYRIDRVALFDKEKVKVILSRDETRILNELLRGISKFEVKVKNEYMLSVQNYKMKYSIETPNGGQPYMDVHIQVSGVAEQSHVGVMSKKPMKYYEQQAEKELEKTYTRVLKKLQQHKVDPVGFGLHYLGTHYDQDNWEQWQQLYGQLDFRVHADVTLDGTGVLK
jgi:spore germination protein KC